MNDQTNAPSARGAAIPARRWINLLPLVLALGACGGTNGGGSSITLPPPPPPAQPAGAFAPILELDASQDLTVMGMEDTPTGVDVRYDAELDAYLVSLPTGEEGAFFSTSEGPLFWSGQLVNPANTDQVASDYLSFSRIEGARYAAAGFALVGDGSVSFAVGMATPEGAVPVTGEATYDFRLLAGLDGRGEMNFDFRAGTLSGWVVPVYSDAWYSFELGEYRFTDTVFGVGSTHFSGALDNEANGWGGSFAGLFAGPGAEEMMGLMTIDYVDIYSEALVSTPTIFTGLRR